jgi:hypothetical protein
MAVFIDALAFAERSSPEREFTPTLLNADRAGTVRSGSHADSGFRI